MSGLPELPGLATAASAPPPDDEACFALWRKYDMLPNVRRHSRLVAHIATLLARRAAEKGVAVHVPEVRASALLHDLAKTYCLRHGGSHAQLGGAWAVAETRNYALAQGVRHDQTGNVWYYLAEEPMNSYQAAVWYNGRTNRVRTDYAGTGVRPTVTLSLNAYAFTEGDGTTENPYR